MTKLQLALDTLSLRAALALLDKVAMYIDIAEVGTPFVYRSGLNAVRKIRAAHPELEILCDGKIMDAGAYESGEMFAAGADYVSVLGVTDNATIKACVAEAGKYGGKVSVDMICVPDPVTRVAEVESFGADIISVHTGVDQQAKGRTPLDDLKEMKACAKKAQISVAGGINLDTVTQYLVYHPDVIIIGGGILSQKDPVEAAKKIRSRMNAYAETLK